MSVWARSLASGEITLTLVYIYYITVGLGDMPKNDPKVTEK